MKLFFAGDCGTIAREERITKMRLHRMLSYYYAVILDAKRDYKILQVRFPNKEYKPPEEK